MLLQVYICQNATLLEITCHDPYHDGVRFGHDVYSLL